ncbi:MAG: hypothetical protein AAFX08_09340 [Pseudomonadota bacterium]
MRRVTFIYLTFFLLAVTWPGFTLINRPTPIVLGLPFNLFCLAVLILAGMGVLYALYRSEGRR